MGVLLVAAVSSLLALSYSIHTIIDTPYDWLILWTLAVAIMYWLPDEPVSDILRISRGYFKSKVDYQSWWKK